MTPIARLKRICWILVAIGLATPLLAQPPQDPNAVPTTPTPPAVAAPPPQLSADSVKARIEQIKANTELAEDVRTSILATYDEVLKEIQRYTDRVQQLAVNKQSVATAPKDLETIQAKLKQVPRQPDRAPAEASLTELRSKFVALQGEADQLKRELEELSRKVEGRPKRLADIPVQIEDAESRLKQVDTSIATPPPGGEAPEVSAANALLLQAKQQSIRQEIDTLQSERQAISATAELVDQRREWLTRRLSLIEQTMANYSKAIEEIQTTEQEQLINKALRVKLEEIKDPKIQSVARANKQLAESYNNTEVFEGIRTRVDTELKEVDALLETVKGESERMKRRLDLAGSNQVSSTLMRASRALLPDPRQWTRRVAWAGSTASETALVKIEIDESRRPLIDIEQRIAEILGRVEGTKSFDRLAQESSLRTYLQIQRDLYSAASLAYDDLLNNLSEYDRKGRDLIRETRDLDEFIAERILWVQSAPPIRVADVQLIAQGALDVISPARWLSLAEVVSTDFNRRPTNYILLALALIFALLVRRSVRQRMRSISERVTKDYVGTPHLTLYVLLYTVLVASLWPVGLILFAREFVHSTSEPDVLAIGAAMQGTAVLLLVLEFIRHVCRPSGLATNHFRWREPSVRHLRSNIHLLSLVLVPIVFVTVLLNSDTETPERLAMTRALFVGGSIALAVFLYRTFHPKHGVVEGIGGIGPKSWTIRLRPIWYPILVLMPITWATLAIVGYVDTAVTLYTRLMQSLAVLAVVVVINGFLVRWLYAVRGRLALEQARKKRRDLEAAAAAADAAGVDAKPAAEEPEPTVDLSVVNTQTRRMLSLTVAVTLISSIIWIWSDILPAFGVLERFAFWSKTEMIWETEVDPESGTTHLVQTERTSPVTLATFLIVLVMGFVAVAAARNVPGFLEVTVLTRLPFDAGVRFAVTTVARYAISILGLLFISNQLGFRWDSIQWLAAAFTVGLGFGLQEIVSNFVSGLILLVERPIRIGDLVSVGDVSGTVTRIQMRATTIRDWSRKELIVPNRQFITNSFVNWTLSDRILRVAFDVGIAYGSDTRKAVQIMIDIANRHPNILKDPEPWVTFQGFGDSTLNFQLFTHVDNVDSVLATRHAINTEINDEFNRQGIVIAFPQRDVNLRVVSSKESLDDALQKQISGGADPHLTNNSASSHETQTGSTNKG